MEGPIAGNTPRHARRKRDAALSSLQFAHLDYEASFLLEHELMLMVMVILGD